MPTNKQTKARSTKSQRPSKTISDAANGDEEVRILGSLAVEKPARGDPTNQPTPEEFGERGMGMAAKE